MKKQRKFTYPPNRTFTCFRCGGHGSRPPCITHNICMDCSAEHSVEMQRAGGILGYARKKGIVEHFHGKSCVDCGLPAQCHDHRDYTKPLEVEPVCDKCNYRRGYGLDSKMRSYPPKAHGKGVLTIKEPS